MLDRPEPQGAPVVHSQLQAGVRTGVALLLALVKAGQNFVLLANGSDGAFRLLLLAVNRQPIAGRCLQLLAQLNLALPQLVHRLAQKQQIGDLLLAPGGVKSLAPLLGLFQVLRFQAFDHLIVVIGHARVAHQEVVHLTHPLGHALALRALLSKGQTLGSALVPALPGCRGLQLLHPITLAPRPNQGVAVDQLGAEPGHVTAGENGVQPQRHLGKFHGHGVEVDAVHVAVGDVHFDLLQLRKALVVGNQFPALLLFALQISLGQLVDRFVQKGGAAHGRLANRQTQNLVGALALQQLLQGIPHQTLGQHFGGVVGGRALPLAPSQAVNKGALGVHPQVIPVLARLVAHALVLAVLLQGLSAHEVAHVQLVEAIPGALDLVQVLGGDKAAVRKQSLVHRPQLVDAQVGVGYSAAPPLLAGAGTGQAHQVHDAQHYPVAQTRPAQHRGEFGVEDMRLQRGDVEQTVQARMRGQFPQFRFVAGVAVVDHVEQHGQGLVHKEAFPDFVHSVAHGVRNIPQTLQGVGALIGLGLEGRVAQIGAGFDEQHEQHAVHKAQAFQSELTGLDGIGLQIAPLAVGQVVQHLVAQQLDALAQGVLQVLRNPGRVTLGIGVQGVQQNVAVPGHQTVVVQQHRHGLQRAFLAPGKDLVQLELQVALLIPLVAVDKRDLVHADKYDKARGLGGGKKRLGGQILVVEGGEHFGSHPGGQVPVADFGGKHRLAMQNVIVLLGALRGGGQNDPYPGGTVGLEHLTIDRHHRAIVQSDF